MEQLEKWRKRGLMISLILTVITGAILILYMLWCHGVRTSGILETGTVVKAGEKEITFTINGETVTWKIPRHGDMEEGERHSLYVMPDTAYLEEEVQYVCPLTMVLSVLFFFNGMALFTLMEFKKKKVRTDLFH